MAIFRNHPQYLRPLMYGGLAMWLAGMIGASFATKVSVLRFVYLLLIGSIEDSSQAWQLILCQGVLPGLAAAIISFPTYIWCVLLTIILYILCLIHPLCLRVTQWFVDRRGIASGLIITGASLGGVCLPLMTDALLKRFGVPWTMRIWSAITAVLGLLALQFSRPRLPLDSDAPEARTVVSFRSILNRPFIALVR